MDAFETRLHEAVVDKLGHMDLDISGVSQLEPLHHLRDDLFEWLLVSPYDILLRQDAFLDLIVDQLLNHR